MKSKGSSTFTLSLNVILSELLMRYIRNAMETSSKIQTCLLTLDSSQMKSNLKLANSKKSAINYQREAKSRISSLRLLAIAK
jgi:hypothetical protein